MKTDNKLIAEFLGYKILTKVYDGAITIQDGCFNPTFFYNRMEGESWYVYPEFDSDWNWIMLAVEKIKNTIGVKSIDECSEEEWFVTTKLTTLTITNPLPVVYKTVVEFIKWYNQQNK